MWLAEVCAACASSIQPCKSAEVHPWKTREDDELQLLNEWTYRSCKVVGVAVMRVPLHCPNVPLALSGDLSMTLIWCIQVDYVEETAAARHTDTKGLYRTGLISKPQAHKELTVLCLEDQEREAFDKTDENTIPEKATFNHVPQKGLH